MIINELGVFPCSCTSRPTCRRRRTGSSASSEPSPSPSWSRKFSPLHFQWVPGPNSWEIGKFPQELGAGDAGFSSWVKVWVVLGSDFGEILNRGKSGWGKVLSELGLNWEKLGPNWKKCRWFQLKIWLR